MNTRELSVSDQALYEFARVVVDHHDGVQWLDEKGCAEKALQTVISETEHPKVFVGCVRALVMLFVDGRELVAELEFDGWKSRASDTILQQADDNGN